MACSYHLSKSSLLLFFFLSLANSVLCKSIHHKSSPVQAPSPALVGARPPAPVEASTPALAPVDAPSSDLMAPADAPAQDCSPYAHGLLECLDYLQAGSSTAKPDPTCCTDLRSIVKEDVSCLCGLLTGNQNDFGFPINSSRVFSLPYTCAFTLPTSSECNALLGGLTVAAGMPV
ncbi:Bifunctional inhibitor/lipid-transfer protein/seed storage 2S albumin superfamily protein [Rhynchospora pubera]|uniref:Bifunctional inhibitor/lipid-transfer protein/seed storage 2S albumin superfamily protein n=1 Tax=Rhynchospora pubera TaxID=906938 RepID=A0AAV8HMG5_9POAL|nr:Bifunctional inhibitor/lipid-transfer protein/seed storage 2S albumin superfamily protein [Rhynchospora pubera]